MAFVKYGLPQDLLLRAPSERDFRLHYRDANPVEPATCASELAAPSTVILTKTPITNLFTIEIS
jgi:hypothetical protein